MPKLSTVYRQLKVLPLRVILRKIGTKFNNILGSASERIDLTRSTYKYIDSPKGLKNLFIPPDLSSIPEEEKERLLTRTEEIIELRFSLLGSGNNKFSYSEVSAGFEGYIYPSSTPLLPFVVREEGDKIKSKIHDRYLPISWNRDIISGYVWGLDKHGNSLKPRPMPGVDIKNPWELGRMQYLSLLALGYSSLSDIMPDTANNCLSEIRSMVYDFRGSCPPSMGVQWSSAMDVGIRMVNILIANDFLVYSQKFSEYETQKAWQKNLEEMCLEHLEFIANHIEYADGQPNNHYFSNLCSILIISLSLSISRNYLGVANWALGKLIHEIYNQFNSEGSNFEGSTAYHLFTVEMMLIAFSSLSSLSKIEKENLLKSSNIPDNLKLVYSSKTNYTNEKKYLLGLEQVSVKGFKNLLTNIFGYSKFISKDIERYPRLGDEDGGSYVDFNLTKQSSNKNRHYDISNSENSSYTLFFKSNLPEFIYEIYKKAQTKDNYPETGVFKLKNDTIHVFIRNGKLGLYGRGGHNHNDNLSFVFYKSGKEVITDPGTYTYTGHPDYRNLFRETRYHNTPQVNNIQINPFSEETDELFWFSSNRSSPKTYISNDFSYVGSHRGFGKEMKRALLLSDNALHIKDEYFGKINPEKDYIISRIHLHPEISIRLLDNQIELNAQGKWIATVECDSELIIDDYWYSETYGHKTKAKMILTKTTNNVMNWSISF